MEQVRSARKFGISVILLTVLFRLFELGLPQGMLLGLPWPSVSNSIQKETEHAVRSFSYPFESSPPMGYSPEPVLPGFSDAQGVEVRNSSREEPDYDALIAAPLQ